MKDPAVLMNDVSGFSTEEGTVTDINSIGKFKKKSNLKQKAEELEESKSEGGYAHSKQKLEQTGNFEALNHINQINIDQES